MIIQILSHPEQGGLPAGCRPSLQQEKLEALIVTRARSPIPSVQVPVHLVGFNQPAIF